MSVENLRVVVLGGAGGMGKFAVRSVLAFYFVDEVIIVDREGDRARALAQECGPRTNALELSLDNETALTEVLQDADAVINATGSLPRYGVPILRAAIEAGCHYIDFGEEWEPALEMLELNPEARKAGITAVLGMGASPGISNLLAVTAMGQLENIERLVTGWGLGRQPNEDQSTDASCEAAIYRAAAEMILHKCAGPVRVLREGNLIDVPPMQELQLDYPGLGTGTVYTVGHSEPSALQRHFPDLRNSYSVMNVSPAVIDVIYGLASEVKAQTKSLEQATEYLTQLVAKGDEKTSPDSGAGVTLPMLFVTATGQREGRPTTVGVTLNAAPPGGLGGAAGAPMAIALGMIARGDIHRPGVYTPEEIIPPQPFFDELARWCLPKRANARDLLSITFSTQEKATRVERSART